MLRSLKRLKEYSLHATDGEIGSVEDFYFDDHSWTVRYLVARTGSWLEGRSVLISPVALGQPDWESGQLPVGLSCEDIENSPPLEADRPVSRQQEMALAAYYRWPAYWTAASVPMAVIPILPQETGSDSHADPRLRSAAELLGYHLDANGEDAGHVEDILLDDATWILGDIIVDTRNWLPGGKKVRLDRERICAIHADGQRIEVDARKPEIEHLPPAVFADAEDPEQTVGSASGGPMTRALAAERRSVKRHSELQRVPGIGPRKAKALFRDLAILSVPELRRAAKSGRLREVDGVGEKTESQILDWLDEGATT